MISQIGAFISIMFTLLSLAGIPISAVSKPLSERSFKVGVCIICAIIFLGASLWFSGVFRT